MLFGTRLGWNGCELLPIISSTFCGTFKISGAWPPGAGVEEGVFPGNAGSTEAGAELDEAAAAGEGVGLAAGCCAAAGEGEGLAAGCCAAAEPAIAAAHNIEARRCFPGNARIHRTLNPETASAENSRDFLR